MNTKLTLAIVLAAVVCSMGFFVLESDSSDAESVLVHHQQWESGVNVGYTELYGWQSAYVEFSGSVPGLDIRVEYQSGGILGSADKRRVVCDGIPTTAGTYSIEVHAWTNLGYDSRNTVNILIYDVAKYHEVTYSGGLGLVNGQQYYTETIIHGGHPSLPNATYSSGAQTFRGWATTPTATTPNVTSSATITGPTTYYAVFQQNSAYVTNLPGTSTVSHGQSFAFNLYTSPSSASVSMGTTNMAGWGLSLSGKTIMGTVPDGVAPGSYYVVLRTSASGYGTTTQQINVTVPVYIVPPIEKQQTVGTVFSWEPVTNPNNATITINSVRFDGQTMANSRFSMVSRTITGPLDNEGLYEISYTASATGYVSSTAVIRVAATPVPDVVDPASLSSIKVSQRPDEPRTWDFVAVNPINYASISWSVLGTIFQTSSTTAVFEFQTSGVYEVTCSLVGFDGQTVYKSVTVAVLDTYYPELAWVGVKYALVLADSPTVNVGTAIWLTVSTSQVDGTTYTVISGVPPVASAGLTHDYTIGTDARTVTVYAPESVAPAVSFDVEVGEDGYTANITWTGANASVVYYNYGDGSDITTATTHTYTVANAYVITATAVNNIGERIATALFYVDGYDDPTTSTRPLELTDVTFKRGEKVWIPLTILEGETVTLIGSATLFCKLVENVITGDTSNVDLGDYELVVTLTDADALAVQKTITITIVAAEDDEDNDSGISWFYYVIVILVILAVLYVASKMMGRQSGKKGKKGRK